MGTGKVFLGILTGVASGLLLGLLFAPRGGSASKKK